MLHTHGVKEKTNDFLISFTATVTVLCVLRMPIHLYNKAQENKIRIIRQSAVSLNLSEMGTPALCARPITFPSSPTAWITFSTRPVKIIRCNCRSQPTSGIVAIEMEKRTDHHGCIHVMVMVRVRVLLLLLMLLLHHNTVVLYYLSQ